ncbi:hypothetical protein NPIL_595341 [Nephila pilipes]|uniref:Uncharacterized protein n=1 Tax=Nephila pilipes TaxID=299642 RepID=A0A8X6N0I9_NEPPI|nr:hypothetical protein NPIL_595341 [Nephila pilipes]
MWYPLLVYCSFVFISGKKIVFSRLFYLCAGKERPMDWTPSPGNLPIRGPVSYIAKCRGEKGRPKRDYERTQNSDWENFPGLVKSTTISFYHPTFPLPPWLRE